MDSSVKKNGVYCYGVYTMNADTPKGVSQCIDTGKYSLSGTVPGSGTNATITLSTPSGEDHPP